MVGQHISCLYSPCRFVYHLERGGYDLPRSMNVKSRTFSLWCRCGATTLLSFPCEEVEVASPEYQDSLCISVAASGPGIAYTGYSFRFFHSSLSPRTHVGSSSDGGFSLSSWVGKKNISASGSSRREAFRNEWVHSTDIHGAKAME